MAKKYRYVTKKDDDTIENNNNKISEEIESSDENVANTTIMVRYYPITKCFMHDDVVIGTEEIYKSTHIDTRSSIPLFNSKCECIYRGEFSDDTDVSKICDINTLKCYIKLHS